MAYLSHFNGGADGARTLILSIKLIDITKQLGIHKLLDDGLMTFQSKLFALDPQAFNIQMAIFLVCYIYATVANKL